MELVIFLIVWLAVPVIPATIAEGKGRSFWGFYFISWLVSPIITTIVALCLSKEEKVYVPVTPPQHGAQPPADATWRCSCGRYHPKYVSSCVCGKSRTDNAKKATNKAVSTENALGFCEKCGSKLLDDSAFCNKCGTKVSQM